MQQILIYTGQGATRELTGFRVGKVYPLTYTEADGRVIVQLPESPNQSVEMSSEEFAVRFRKTAGK